MKYFMIFLVVLLFVTGVVAGNNDEFRSVWVITWEHINRFDTADQNKARVRKILDNVKKANMNAVLWQVRQGGAVYYNSAYEPWGFYAGYKYPGYDPLAYAIEEAHKRGLELHAWFNVFQVSEDDDTLDPLPPSVKHRNWVCRDVSGNLMPSNIASFSPGLDSVRAYTVKVAMEIVNNYDIDGFHLDYVRWNEYTVSGKYKLATNPESHRMLDGIISAEQEDYLINYPTDRFLWDEDHPENGGVPGGAASWENWWRSSVTKFVRTLHDSIQAVKPWVRLSPAALGKYNWSGWNGYSVVFQDAALWFNEGSIDQLTPMHYHWLTAEGFYDMLQGACAANECWKEPCQPGIDAGRLYTVGPGSYRFDEENVWDNHPSVVEGCRDVAWTDGFQFFSYGQWRDHNYWLEAKAKMFPTITKTRDTGLIEDTAPDAPVVSVTKLDSLKYYIIVNLPAGITEDHWFAIYRSTDENVDQNEDQIIYRRFDKSNFTYTDTFSDIQEYSPYYYYAATMLDRFWNESANSNLFKTDSIPEISPIETPPLTPEHVRVLNQDASTLKVLCDKTDRAAQYVAMISIDGTTFTDSVVADTNQILVSGLTENTVYYFRVKAKNSGGSSDLTKRLFAGVPSADPHKVLVVNGFDRSTNKRYDYIRFYADPVNDRGYPFSYTMNESVIAGKVSLQDFSTVIWILGDESTADHTFDPTEQAKVKTFLDGGGHFFVSGAEIGWDLEQDGGIPDVQFYRNYLKAKYINDAPKGESSTYYVARELERGIFEGLGDIQFDDGSHGTIDVDWPDAIWAAGGAGNVLKFKEIDPIETQGISGIAFEGRFPNGLTPGKLVHLSFPYETIVVDQKRIDMMDRIFDFFEGERPVLPVQAEEVVLAEEFFLHQNYPNPFNPVTKIKFSLMESNPTTLIIYDILGQVVSKLVDEKLVSGAYSVEFDGRNLATGTYFYILRSGQYMMKRKMVLIK